MRRRYGLFFGCGLALMGLEAASGQEVTAGDPAGFGPKGISNALGYRINRLGRVGYMPELPYPVDTLNNGPGVYYNPAFDGIRGAPRANAPVGARGWSFSPPWSSNYRQGEPRKHAGLFGRRSCPDCQ